MTRPLLTDRAAKLPPTQHFPLPPEDACAAIPAALLRTDSLAISALDEATLCEHLAEIAALAPHAAIARAAVPALGECHPAQPDGTVQGLLEIAHEVARALAALTGIDRFSLQPPTLAAAERAALAIAKASFARTDSARTEIVVPQGGPDAAASDVGLSVRPVPRLATGDLDVDALMEVVGPRTVAVVASWLTPEGAFERNLLAAAEVAHAQGALLCVDASGLAALAGRTRVGDAGADICWLSLRELCPVATTAAVGVRTALTEFLASPIVGRTRDGYELDAELSGTIGRLALGPAPIGDVLAAYIELLTLGEEGLRARAERLVLGANADWRPGSRPRLRTP